MTEAAATEFRFDAVQLKALASGRAQAYQAASPFPHVVLDDFLPTGLAEQCAAEFPGPEAGWDFYADGGNTKKFATSDEALMGPLTRQLVAAFNSRPMIEFLEELTGITGLVTDPQLLGGGLHQLNPGGFLNVHADFNVHPHLKLDRRINVLLYVNPNWQEEWAGHLELWNEDMSVCAQRIAPVANRVVIFNTTSTAFHGNPEPVACPDGNARRSLAFYYYTIGRPEEERAAAHTTLYQEPGKGLTEAGGNGAAAPRPSKLKAGLRRVLPPIVVDGAKRLRRRA